LNKAGDKATRSFLVDKNSVPKKITVILGHPDSSSYCGVLAAAYVQAAVDSGHSVKFFKLGEIIFNPILHHGYNQRQELEPGLKEIQDAITWSEHLVFVYPIWWGSMPALLKGFFDRVFLPGYAFKYRENSPFVDKLLAGRSAHAVVTMDAPVWYYRFIYKQPGHNQIKKVILEFCGIKPVKFTSFGSVRKVSIAQREKWLQKVKSIAKMP
jgi:putative NADPH-quinone reductase